MTQLTKFLLAATLFAVSTGAFAQSQEEINNNKSATTDRQVSGFSGIRLQGPFNVYVTIGTTESVKLDAPDEILSRIVTEVNGHVLNIQNKHDNWSSGEKSWWSDKSWWHTHKRISIYITAKYVSGITISGSGHVFFNNAITANALRLKVRGSGQLEAPIDVKELQGKISGSSYIKLSGNAGNSTVRISGSGHFSGEELVTINSAVHVSGSGHADVNANEKVDAVVRGSAHVGYTGTATNINASKSGSGSVSRL